MTDDAPTPEPATPEPATPEPTSPDAAPFADVPFDRFGGEAFFTRLVAAFYVRTRQDAVLAPMYPPDDWEGAERRLRMFLMQYWGGPKTYGEERGHPRLRMRHATFHVDSTARDHWLANMHEALAEQGLPEADEAEIWAYLVSAAFAMQNARDDDRPHPGIPMTRGPQ